MSQYVLLAMAARTAALTIEDVAFPTIGRTRWAATLRLGHVAPGGSLEIAIEASSDGETWEQVGTFGLKNAAGEFTISATAEPPTLSVQSYHRVIRAVRVSQVGDCIFEVTAACPFLDATVSEDAELLPKRSKDYDQGIARLLAQAEADVLELLKPDPATGALSDDVANAALFPDSIRRAIALQTDHLHERERLTRAKEASAHVTRRELGRYGVGVKEQVHAFIPGADLVWRHR